MKQSIVVSRGKSFTVELQSMYGSTPYGWCLSTLPKGIVLTGTELVKVPSPHSVGPVNQKFYFAPISDNLDVILEFVLTAVFKPEDIQDVYTVNVQVGEGTQEQFVPYSENAVTNVKYGYMCDSAEAEAEQLSDDDAMKTAMPYGMVYVNDDDDCALKYGFPNC